MAHDLQAFGRRLETSFAGRCLGSFVSIQGIDRAMVIASQAFTALIPLLILVSALAPADRRDLVSTAIIRRFELQGSSASAVEQVFAHPENAATGTLSVVLLVFSGVSLARRLQRMYVQVWRLEHRSGVRGSFNAGLGLGALLIEIALLYAARSLVRELPLDWALAGAVSVLGSFVLWTTVPWLLLNRMIAWRRLVPLGALTALGAVLYGQATKVYMPRLMETYSERYGLFGVTLALVGWLLCVSLVVVVATVVAAELDRAQEPWARRIRAGIGLEPALGNRTQRDH